MAFEGLDGIVEAHRRTDAVPGLSVAVAMGGRVRWLRGFGMADLAAGSRARPETAYLWFSMTKIVTATAVMRLAERGVIDLDAPVTDYVPPFAAVRRAAAVTVRHLLSHSSGLANPVPVRWVHAAGIPGPDARAFVERLLARHRTLKFRPGERARYSNLGYLVLGEAVANVTGVPFTDAVRALVLDPLGMRHTGFTYEECGGAAATGYQRLAAPLTPLLRAVLPAGIVGGRHGRYVAYRPFHVHGAAYGGLVGGVDDAVRLAMLHLDDGAAATGGHLLSPGAVAAMRRIVPRGGRYDFGLGWYRPSGPRTGPDFVEHLGGGSGFFTVLRLYPAQRLGVVVMGNTTRYDHESLLAAIARYAMSRSEPAPGGTAGGWLGGTPGDPAR